MRIITTLEQLGLPRIRHHHRGHGHPAVFIEPRQQAHRDVSRAGLERWRAASYSDPWPDRA